MKVCILIWLHISTENQIFLRNSFFSNADIHMFLYWFIGCLQMNQICITSCWFHRKLVIKAKQHSYKLYLYTVFLQIFYISFSKREWLLEALKWTSEVVFMDRLSLTAKFFLAHSYRFSPITYCFQWENGY